MNAKVLLIRNKDRGLRADRLGKLTMIRHVTSFLTAKNGIVPIAILVCFFLTPSASGQNVNIGTNIPPMTRGPGMTNPPPSVRPTTEEPGLTSALASFNLMAASQGKRLVVWTVLATETKVPEATLRRQQAQSSLGYGELLVAHFLAVQGRSSFDKIVAQRSAAGTWSQLARNLQIAPASIATRLAAARTFLSRTKAEKSKKIG